METNTNQSPVDQCECSKNNVVIIGMRSLSLLVSAVIVLCFFIFMTGYFLGKRSAYEDVAGVLVQDSLSDRVYASMCSIYGYKDEKASAEEQELETEVAEADQEAETPAVAESVATQPAESVEVATQAAPAADTVHYYAQLAGFGSLQSAEQFARKLRKKNIKVSVAQRRSKSARGKTVSWYQVVTGSYTDRNQLDSLVSRLQKEEKLHDIRVLNC